MSYHQEPLEGMWRWSTVDPESSLQRAGAGTSSCCVHGGSDRSSLHSDIPPGDEECMDVPGTRGHPSSSHTVSCPPAPGNPGSQSSQAPLTPISGLSPSHFPQPNRTLFSDSLPHAPQPWLEETSLLPLSTEVPTSAAGQTAAAPCRCCYFSGLLRHQLICFNLLPSLTDQCFNPARCVK